MDDNQTKYNTIERYLSGALSPDELTLFEKQLAEDASLREDLQLHKELQISISDKQAEAVEQTVKSIGMEFIHSKNTNPEVRSIPLWKRPLTIAASLIFLITMAFLINYYFANPSSAKQLYALHYETPDLLTIKRSDDSGISPALEQAYQAYDSQDYEAAIKYFAEATGNKQAAIVDQYYNAISYLAQTNSNPDQTITLLQAVIDDGNNSYVEAAQWYTAMAWLKKGDIDQAKIILKQIISNGSGKYFIKARDLVKTLE